MSLVKEFLVPHSCDTFVALPPATANGRVIFGKNSDRPDGEVQEVVYVPAADHPPGSKVQCTYITLNQVERTHAVILSKPSWMWGAEMGANDQGVCVGNEAVWTKLGGPSDLEEKLLGMDMVRLALERASSASQAVDVIGQLLENHGQGGPCSEEAGQMAMSYHNSFLIADPTSAWVLETAGPFWVAEHITEGVRNISNELTIGTKIDRSSTKLIEEAKKLGLYKDEMGPFNFTQVFSESGQSLVSRMSYRYRQGLRLLKELSSSGEFSMCDMFKILRDEDSGICIPDGYILTTASQVSVLTPPSQSAPSTLSCHWFTATPNPLISVFKPFVFVPGASVGTTTVSPQFGDRDPVKNIPRFRSQVDRRHALYHGHETLRQLVDRQNAKGTTLLGKLKELEEKCVKDIVQFWQNSEDKAQTEIACIFQNTADTELNLYNFGPSVH